MDLKSRVREWLKLNKGKVESQREMERMFGGGDYEHRLRHHIYLFMKPLMDVLSVREEDLTTVEGDKGWHNVSCSLYLDGETWDRLKIEISHYQIDLIRYDDKEMRTTGRAHLTKEGLHKLMELHRALGPGNLNLDLDNSEILIHY